MEIKLSTTRAWKLKTQEGWDEKSSELAAGPRGDPQGSHWDVAGEDTDSAGQLAVHKVS